MTATVSNNLKTLLIDHWIEDFNDASNNYYIAYGRSEDWTDSDGAGNLVAETPSNSLRGIRRLRNGLQSAIVVSNYSYAAPRYNWSNGTVYDGYDDAVGTNSGDFYVVNDDNEVYICLQQGKNSAGVAVSSTVKPSYTTAAVAKTDPFKTADGYSWQFLYTLSSNQTNNYLTSNYIPVDYIEDSSVSGTPYSSLSSFQQEQFTVQSASVAGQILGIAVTYGGSNYTSAPTVAISGDGSGAAATAYVSGGAVVKVEINESGGVLQFGQDYTNAVISFSGGGGSGATARAILSPAGGISANARTSLNSTALMFNVKPDGDEGGDFLINQDFRQVALIRNALWQDSDGIFDQSTGSFLPKLRFSLGSLSGTISADDIITGTSTNAQAYVDTVDSDYIFYHQTETTGFVGFDSSESISSTSGGSATLIDLINAEIDKDTGDILYYDNRSAVSRTSGQTEDIKIVIQF